MSRKRRPSGRTTSRATRKNQANGPLFGALWRTQAYEFRRCNGRFPAPEDRIKFPPNEGNNPDCAFAEDRNAVAEILRRTSNACGIVKIEQLSGTPVTAVPKHFGGVHGRWWFLDGPRRTRVIHIDMRRQRPTEEPLPAAPEESPLLAKTILVTRKLIRKIEDGLLRHVITDQPIGEPGEIVMLTDGQKTLPVKILGEADKPNSLLAFFKKGPKPINLALMAEAWEATKIMEARKPIGFQDAIFTTVTTDLEWEILPPATSHLQLVGDK